MAPHRLTDTLFRGDGRDEVRLPDPSAEGDVVAHILARRGHDSPYLSTSESRELAQHFAVGGRIWTTTAANALP